MVKLGKAFSDSLISQKSLFRLSARDIRGWGARVTLLYILIITAAVVVFLRVFHLTVVKGQENRELAQNNRVRSLVIHAPRGIFTDRRGQPLVKNIPGYRVGQACDSSSSCPNVFMSDEDWQKQGLDKTIVNYEKDFFREYIYPEFTAHVLGYISEITAEELSNSYYTYQDYIFGDHLGRMGLESAYEKNLRGTDGKELIEVDAAGSKVRTLGVSPAVPGENIDLSLDIDLQKVAYEALGDLTGAVVVTQPKTGEVLALVSKPAIDTNLIHTGLSAKDWEDINSDPRQPLFDRAVSGVYPPGSVFKLISAVAGLETGKIKPETVFEDTGILRIGEFSFGNWYYSQYGKTEGMVNLVKAIARSNDIFFYKLGEAVGVDDLANWGRRFGLGQKTGIELSGEAEGVMPDRQWRQKVRGAKWYLGDTYHVAIGQGDLQVTPLQVNLMTAAVANGGKLCRPVLVKSVGQKNNGSDCTDLKINPRNLEIITEGMRRACNKGESDGYPGTGWPLFDFKINKEFLGGNSGTAVSYSADIACKTGTAETGDAEASTHAWFTAFAPLPKNNPGSQEISGEPEIAVTVMVEKGGEGSSVAAPIARKIFEEWLKR